MTVRERGKLVGWCQGWVGSRGEVVRRAAIDICTTDVYGAAIVILKGRGILKNKDKLTYL